ncbi:phosphoribosylformimino-5-aminoimidazole carboxamide ribotide isomerase [Haloferula luteola]|uniref:Phosphoribosylformimino-5-aminoimidazole carboxamide ribotide isomerase n=1 Tax=Haloferula luteola TaxID=595692 RepID=A0A840VHB2_9BACT|nr:phosphoribosylformimino-5-aminoimidazole carboxamide ribotide isomerase [Haloferula luteola]MBB5352151.1 phosphoribosylformimino-5-aminoimidazole carboxamide ribotide isomerase [Haloferula luteola]
MTRFRPCIDLHQGKVKQIVGGTLRDEGPGPVENFTASQSSSWFAEKFRADALVGGHVIQLGPGNDAAAREALAAWPGGLQIGGGIQAENAASWIEAGASHVIVTSWLFEDFERFSENRVKALAGAVGAERVVIDLSCRRRGDRWVVATQRWQTLTNLEVTPATLDDLAEHCDEFLIHAADVEGLCGGIDEDLVALLGSWKGRAVTYAGGVANFEDLQMVDRLSRGGLDVTVGSALDLFGGSGVKYTDLVAWNRRQPEG